MPDAAKAGNREADALRNTHTLLNTLRAAYQGLYIYFTATSRLTDANMADEIQETSSQLDMINRWWADLKRGTPLPGIGSLPRLAGNCETAWHMLVAIERRYTMLCEILGSKQHIDALFSGSDALQLRVAVHCEHAYARQHYIEGMIVYGAITNDQGTIDTYAGHTASCQEEIRRVNACLAETCVAGEHLSQDLIREIFEETLTLPGILSQKVADIREIFGLFRGKFDFEQAGIPPDQIAEWKHFGFKPTGACQWHYAGFDPKLACAWTLVGISNPVEALQYELRQFDVNAAMPWWNRRINGRAAAAWRRSGYTPEQAAAYREKGIGHPSQIEPHTSDSQAG